MSGGGRRPTFGGFFSGAFEDPFFSGAFEGFGRFDNMMSGMFSDRQQRQAPPQARQPSTAREIPIEGPDQEEEEEPTVPHRRTGPLIHELPDHEELHLHPHLLPDATSHPDTVQEPEDHSARPYQHYHPPEDPSWQPSWHAEPPPPPPRQQQQQYGQPRFESQAQAADPLAAMGTGPPPAFAPYPQPPPPPPPRPPPAVRTTGGAASSAADEPASPLLVHLADGMVISDESPRHFQHPPGFQHTPTAGREARVAPWPPSGHSAGQQGGIQQQQQQPYQPYQQQADSLTGAPAAPAAAPPPPQQQQRQQPWRRSAGAPSGDEHGAGMFVRTPTAQTPPTGAVFGSPPEDAGACAATAAAAPMLEPQGRAPAGIRSTQPGSPPDLIDLTGPSSSNGNGDGGSQPASQPPPATESVGVLGPAGTGRRQRRPSSRSAASQQAQAAVVDLAAQQAQHARRQWGRQVRRRSGWPGGSDGEVEEGGEGALLTGAPGGEEDPEWQPRAQGPQLQRTPPSGARTPPAPKRTRRGASGGPAD